MIKTFTPDDLLRYLYEDTTPAESREIKKALQTDERLQAEYHRLHDDLQLLNSLLLQPATVAIAPAKKYARAMNMAALRN